MSRGGCIIDAEILFFMGKYMDLKKIAMLANVSVSTASKAFSGSREVSESTREAVFAIAKENGCFEKYYKPKYEKRVIALLCPEILGIHYGRMATDMEREISERGDTLILSVTNFSHKTQSELIDYYVKFCHVDGIIIIEPKGNIKSVQGVPIVRIDFENELRKTDCVKTEISPAMDEAVECLLSLGHRRIGFIGEKFATPEEEFFLSAMERNSLEIKDGDVIISDRRFEDAGYYAMDEMLKDNDRPTAFFAAYSHIALGIMQRLKEEGMCVPHDLSLICMDDIQATQYSDKKLSSIKMHLDELSHSAVEMLYKKIEGGGQSPRVEMTVIREFSVGETVGKA